MFQVSPLQLSAGQAVVPQVVVSGSGVSVQLLVPLQAELMQAVEVQLTEVPLQLPPKQTSLYVHALPSLHGTDVRHAQVPPALVQ